MKFSIKDFFSKYENCENVIWKEKYKLTGINCSDYIAKILQYIVVIVFKHFWR